VDFIYYDVMGVVANRKENGQSVSSCLLPIGQQHPYG